MYRSLNLYSERHRGTARFGGTGSSNYAAPLAFASRTDLQDLRQAIAEKASAKDL